MNTENKKPTVFGVCSSTVGTLYIMYDEDTETLLNRADGIKTHINRAKLDYFFAIAREIGFKVIQI